MQQWTVQRLALTPSSASRRGITAWGFHTDGCRLETLRPHMEACLRLMDLTVSGFRAGAHSPFFTVLDNPSRYTQEAMRTFERLMAERVITGLYCDEPGRVMLMEYYRPAKIVDIEWRGDSFLVQVASTESQALGLVQSGFSSCESVKHGEGGTKLSLVLKARDESELAKRLRLAGNMMQLRWDRRDQYTLSFLGEPLL